MSFLRRFRGPKIAGQMLWLAAACTSMCMDAAGAQQPRARFPLHPEQVVLAMDRFQLPTHGVQVKLAAPVTSSSAETRLQIKSMAMISPREMRLRVGCSEQSACLPFFALAMYAEPVDTASLPVKLAEKPAGSEQALPPAKLGSAASASVHPAEAPLMRSGSPATLDLESNKVHVSIEVVCLESGTAGEKIRVATRDHKQMYVAEVVTSKLLKGTF